MSTAHKCPALLIAFTLAPILCSGRSLDRPHLLDPVYDFPLPTVHNASQSTKSQNPKPTPLRNPLNDLLDEAQAAIDKNDFAAAIPPLQKFIADQPDVAFAHFQLAYVYTNLKQPLDARPEYERAIALDPKFFEAYLNLGTLLLQSNPKDAVAPLRKAVELQPAQNRPRYLLAVALDTSGDEAGAVEQFKAVLSLEPNDLPALNFLARYSLDHQNPADAESKFRHVLQIDPKDRKAMLGLAQSLEAQKKPEAAEALQHYLSTGPADEDARSQLIHSLIEQKQYDAALAEIDKSNGANPPSIETLELRADVLVAQNKLDEAIATIQQAIALKPQDANLHGGLGRLYMTKRDYPSAEKELIVALKLDRTNLGYVKNLASTYYLEGNYSMALSGIAAAEKMEPLNAGQWFIRALCYDKLRQVQPALDAYRKFLELDQNHDSNQVWQANQRIQVLQKMAHKN